MSPPFNMKSEADVEYRMIWMTALMQACALVGGTLFVATMNKLSSAMHGLDPDRYTAGVPWIIIHYGFSLLLLPIAWMVAALSIVRLTTRPWMAHAIFVTGVAALPFGIVSFIAIGLMVYTTY